MARGDRGLQLVRPRLAGPQGLGEQLLTLGDLRPVPARAVLVGQQDQVARRADPAAAARVGQQQQRQQPCHLGLARHQRGQRAGQPDRLVAQIAPDQGVAGRRFVARGEHQVHDAQHAADPPGPLVGRGEGQRDARLPDLAFRADQPLGHGRLGDQERGRDLRGGQPADRPQRQRHPDRGVQGRVAAGQDEPQLVIGAAGRPVRDRPAWPAAWAGRPGGARGTGRARGGPAQRAVPHGRGFFLRAAALPAQPVGGLVPGHADQPGPGWSGTPPPGHWMRAAAQASCTASSAISRSPTRRATVATAAHQWARNTSSYGWLSPAPPGRESAPPAGPLPTR